MFIVNDNMQFQYMVTPKLHKQRMSARKSAQLNDKHPELGARFDSASLMRAAVACHNAAVKPAEPAQNHCEDHSWCWWCSIFTVLARRHGTMICMITTTSKYAALYTLRHACGHTTQAS